MGLRCYHGAWQGARPGFLECSVTEATSEKHLATSFDPFPSTFLSQPFLEPAILPLEDLLDSRGQDHLTLVKKAVIIDRGANRVEAFVRVLRHMAGHALKEGSAFSTVSMPPDGRGDCQWYTAGG